MSITSKIILALCMLPVTANALEWRGNLTIGQIRMNTGWAYFSTTSQPPKTCNLWGEYIVFDYKTDVGRAFYSALLAAKAANQKIDVWYEASTSPDTDQSTGCNDNTASKLVGLRIR